MICLAGPMGRRSGNDRGTASGAFLLGQFLAHRKDNVLLTRSDQLAMPEVLMDNVIFLGPVSGNRQIEALSKGQPLVLEPDGIRNLSPQPGRAGLHSRPAPGVYSGQKKRTRSSATCRDFTATATFCTYRGIRFRAPWPRCGRSPIRRSRGALVSKLKSPDGSVPRFYQMVLRVQSMDSMPIEISYMFHRDLSPRSQALRAVQLEEQPVDLGIASKRVQEMTGPSAER